MIIANYLNAIDIIGFNPDVVGWKSRNQSRELCLGRIPSVRALRGTIRCRKDKEIGAGVEVVNPPMIASDVCWGTNVTR